MKPIPKALIGNVDIVYVDIFVCEVKAKVKPFN